MADTHYSVEEAMGGIVGGGALERGMSGDGSSLGSEGGSLGASTLLSSSSGSTGSSFEVLLSALEFLGGLGSLLCGILSMGNMKSHAPVGFGYGSSMTSFDTGRVVSGVSNLLNMGSFAQSLSFFGSLGFLDSSCSGSLKNFIDVYSSLHASFSIPVVSLVQSPALNCLIPNGLGFLGSSDGSEPSLDSSVSGGSKGECSTASAGTGFLESVPVLLGVQGSIEVSFSLTTAGVGGGDKSDNSECESHGFCV